MNRSIGGILGGVFFVGIIVARVVVGVGGGSTEAKIQRTVKELSAKLPMQIDAVTRLTRVEGSGVNLSYHYTISVSPSPSEFAQLQREVTRKAKSSSEMKPMFDDGVIVWYKDHDQSGKLLHQFSVR